MLKTKKILMTVSAAFVFFSISASAADQVTEVTVNTEGLSTVGRISEKSKLLSELEYDLKIAETKAKIKEALEPKDSVKSAGNNALSLPPPVNMPGNLPLPHAAAPAVVEDNFYVTALFGREKSMEAEVSYNGTFYTVRKGSATIPGWIVSGISNTKVTLKSLKDNKRKELFVAAQPKQENYSGQNGMQSPNSIANLPRY